MTAPLIGLLGRKRSGKDTAAAALVERGWVRVAFADPMRAGLLDLDPFVRVEADEIGPLAPEIEALHWELPIQPRLAYLVDAVGWDRAKGIREVRRLLQHYGNGVREAGDDEVWVRAAMDKVWCHLDLAFPRPVVVTDVRYPNEALAVKRAGGTLVRITRPGLASDDTHISETALDDWPVDHHIVNNSTVEALQETASLLAERLP